MLATLDSIYSKAHEHMVAEWEATGKPALEACTAFIGEVDAITSEADAAMRESSRLRGETDAWMKARGLEAQMGTLGEFILRELGFVSVHRDPRINGEERRSA